MAGSCTESGKEAAAPKPSKYRAVILVGVTRDGASVSGLEVAFSRTISGRAPDFKWFGTIDVGGGVEIEIAVDPGGAVLADLIKVLDMAFLGFPIYLTKCLVMPFLETDKVETVNLDEVLTFGTIWKFH